MLCPHVTQAIPNIDVQGPLQRQMFIVFEI
jgi:hypothetical protein